jgi:hypothetical protein
MNKTKRIVFGIGIVLAVLVVVFTASVAAGNLFYFAPQDSSAESGNETTVKLMLNTTHTDIRSFMCHIDLDTDVVNVTSGSRGSYYWHAWNWLVRDDPVYGPYLYVYAIQYSPTGPEPPEVELGVFTFEGVNPGVSPQDFIRRQQPGEQEPPNPTLLTDTNNDLLPFDWTNGTFTCAGEEETFENELVLGWNLISLPLMPEDNSTSTILSGTMVYNAVYRYNATSKLFEDVTEGIMVPGIGYFVNVTTAGTWNYTGTAYTSMNISLKKGLNLIGWLNCAKQISGNLTSIAGKYNYNARWNTGYEVYEPQAPDIFNDFETMERGEGYWIAAKEDCTLTVSCSS